MKTFQNCQKFFRPPYAKFSSFLAAEKAALNVSNFFLHFCNNVCLFMKVIFEIFKVFFLPNLTISETLIRFILQIALFLHQFVKNHASNLS